MQPLELLNVSSACICSVFLSLDWDPLQDSATIQHSAIHTVSIPSCFCGQLEDDHRWPSCTFRSFHSLIDWALFVPKPMPFGVTFPTAASMKMAACSPAVHQLPLFRSLPWPQLIWGSHGPTRSKPGGAHSFNHFYPQHLLLLFQEIKKKGKSSWGWDIVRLH